LKGKGHAVQLFLAPEIRSALIKFMAKNDLDKEFAALLLLVKALYQERLIGKEVYEVYSSRYNRKLVVEHPQKLTVLEMQEKQCLEEKTRQFSMVLDQWNLHGKEWRQKWIVEAEEWKDQIPTAKLVLDLGNGGKDYTV
jgi:hypothetical protein